MILSAMLADAPLAVLAQSSDDSPLFSAFRRAFALRQRGGEADARSVLRSLLAIRSLSSHDRLQTWSALRELGEAPDHTLLAPLGVVVEVGLEEGLDVLSAYDDGCVTYLNHSGRRVARDHRDASLDALVQSVLDAGRVLPPLLGVPWKGPKRVSVLCGQVRLNIVTPAGLYFGEGPHADIARDPTGGPLLMRATRLMVKVTE